MKRGIKLREKKIKTKSSFEVVTACPRCNSSDVIEDLKQGNLTCRACGNVISTHQIDFEREWMEYEKESGKTSKGRAGGPEDPLLGAMGMTTGVDKSAGGKELERAQRRSQQNREKTLKRGFQKIEALCQKINLNRKFVTKAKEIYKALWDKRALKGKSSQAFYAASILTACKLEGSLRTFNEIVVLTGIHKSDLGKTFRHIKSVLDLNSTLNKKKLVGAGAQKVVLRFCSHLRLSNELTNTILYTCERIEELSKKGAILDFQGKHPDTVASGVIHFVTSLSDQKKTIDDITEVTMKAKTTVLECSKKMIKYKEHILPKKFLDSIK